MCEHVGKSHSRKFGMEIYVKARMVLEVNYKVKTSDCDLPDVPTEEQVREFLQEEYNAFQEEPLGLFDHIENADEDLSISLVTQNWDIPNAAYYGR